MYRSVRNCTEDDPEWSGLGVGLLFLSRQQSNAVCSAINLIVIVVDTVNGTVVLRLQPIANNRKESFWGMVRDTDRWQTHS